MPIHLAPCSRRHFLKQATATIAGLSSLRFGFAAPAADSLTLAFVSDTHIPESPEVEARGINMTRHLQQTVREINQLPNKPLAVLFNGDCAYLKGKPEDYANFAKCVQPLVDAGQTLHMTMGNHDDREPFYHALQAQRPDQALVASRHISLIETPFANLFLLDTLKSTNVVTGEMGEAQLQWLAKALDAHSNKPAILIAHHTPQFEPPAEGKPWGGIADTDAFFKLIESKKQVKAFVFGHSHRWMKVPHESVQLINLPANAYVFDEKQTSAWALGRLHAKGLDFELRALNPQHPKHGEVLSVTW